MSSLWRQLTDMRDRGAIPEISYQFCEFLKRLGAECSDELLLAAAMVTQRREAGDVCIELTREVDSMFKGDSLGSGIPTPSLQDWVKKLKSSRCVGTPGQSTPLILDSSYRLYLQKYWLYEAHLADQLLSKAAAETSDIDSSTLQEELDQLFDSNDQETDWQKIAAFTAIKKKLTIISGGPGTGKTTTVVKILLLMARMGILGHTTLAAPTGKAASRLMESVNGAMEEFMPDIEILEQLPDKAVTIHKLLGARQHGSTFRYNRDNLLPYDLVIVDEASMIDLALMIKLVDAVPDHAKLILLGDKDQLASVEAGAVMGSICAKNKNRFSDEFIKSAQQVGLNISNSLRHTDPNPLTDNIVLLNKSYRFGEESGVGQLAGAILEANEDKVIDILQGPIYSDVNLQEFEDASGFKSIISDTVLTNFAQFKKKDTVQEALLAANSLGILCVHRRGPLGSEQVNRLIEKLLRQKELIPATEQWYIGKPVMVSRNDYSLGLRNGELGITLRDEEGVLNVFFQGVGEKHRSFYPSRLSYIETAYATTVHKSQGSEYDEVVIVLPRRISPISTRELLYTAVTRARNSCHIIGNPEVVRDAVKTRIDRSTGLVDRLWNKSAE